MRPVVSGKLRQNVADVRPHGRFPDGKLIRDLFIAIPNSNQPQHIDFTRSQIVIRGVIGKFGGNLLRYSLLAAMDCPNGLQKFLGDVAL